MQASLIYAANLGCLYEVKSMAIQPGNPSSQTQSNQVESANVPDWVSFVMQQEVVEAGTTVIVIALIVLLIRSLTALVKASRS